MGGERYNDDKAPVSMILEAKHAVEGCAKVLGFGAQKYERANWRKGLSHTEICDSLLRHLSAYLGGEDKDPESGLPHVDHITCNAIFLGEMTRTHPELDDRGKVAEQRTVYIDCPKSVQKIRPLCTVRFKEEVKALRVNVDIGPHRYAAKYAGMLVPIHYDLDGDYYSFYCNEGGGNAFVHKDNVTEEWVDPDTVKYYE